jgi:hypothetical protein
LVDTASYKAIVDIIKLVFPQSKSSVFRGFNESMEEVDIPEPGKAYIVHYDEQFPKKKKKIMKCIALKNQRIIWMNY